ncbi:PREDICTED: lymphocyte antigen 6D [Hipposideros armiger]|uniref:Lymphocyte antigen 6D n=1 Tax=Hipposideros armiger TaxID=186990 RepID=A0A8B7SLG6_HIPAR|nr:PREDICTED: lymphocyte antigen 6D [Hipposideros armiger]
MKTVLLLLVILAVAAGPARALRCHVCSSASNCKTPQVCSASSRFCRTMIKVESLSGNLVEKECVDSCTPRYRPDQVSSGTAVTLCCQGDLCNDSLSSSAPTRSLLTSTSLGLTLALGLLTFTLAPSL